MPLQPLSELEPEQVIPQMWQHGLSSGPSSSFIVPQAPLDSILHLLSQSKALMSQNSQSYLPTLVLWLNHFSESVRGKVSQCCPITFTS